MSIVSLLPLAIVAAIGADAGSARHHSHLPLIVLAQADADAAKLELEGSKWLLKQIHGADVDPKIPSSLEFDAEGNVFGDGGCNRFRGAAEIDGNAVKFGDLASTMMACEELNSKQEAAFHAALAETAAFRFEEQDLILLNSKEAAVARLSSMK
jgi:heat shock protein HslJ